MQDRLAATWDSLRAQLWPLPTLGILLAVGLGVALPKVDAATNDQFPPTIRAYLFGGGADAARTLLNIIATSMVTVTSLTFSLTIVTLQLASSQFSPRLLRTFSRDRFVHVTLALLVGTFTYALVVLRTVRNSTEAHGLFVPQISVSLAFVLAVASVLALVLFLAHLAREIRVETLLHRVHRDANETIGRVLGSADEPREREGRFERTSPAAGRVRATSSGFLASVDEQAVLVAARDGDAVVALDVPPGSTVVTGTPIGRVWCCDHTDTGDTTDSGDTLERVAERVADAVTTTTERTSVQDVSYGLQQLIDVAVKALSPGINDPTTAVHALGHASSLLTALADQPAGHRELRDDDGALRVLLARHQFGDLLDLAVSAPRRYGASDPALVSRIATLLREVGWSVRGTPRADVVREQVCRLHETVDAQAFGAVERESLEGLLERAAAACRGDWS